KLAARILKYDRDAGLQVLRRQGSKGLPVELERAAHDRREPGEGEDEAGLSPSIGARQGHPLAAPDLEREASHHRRVVEPGCGYPEVPGAQHLGSVRLTTRRRACSARRRAPPRRPPGSAGRLSRPRPAPTRTRERRGSPRPEGSPP